jgi:tetratricopeptide (TPR) repeat protein
MSAHRSLSSSLLLTLAIAAVPAASRAQQSPAMRIFDSARVVLARATPAGDVAGMRSAQALLARALTAQPHDPWLLHYLGFALYREATFSFGMGSDAYLPILERADSILELSATYGAIPETFALRSGTIGMMIGSNPLKGMTMGPRASAQMEKALELGPDNPRVWMLRGIGAFNTPAMFGGGLDRAETYIKKAIELYASDKPAAPAPAWGANEAHAWLGQVYARQDRKDLARAEYMKALAIEPNDNWVKMSLLPALDRK